MKMIRLILVVVFTFLVNQSKASSSDTLVVKLFEGDRIYWDVKKSEIIFGEGFTKCCTLNDSNLLNLLIRVGDTRVLSETVCTKSSSCKYGDVIFLYLMKCTLINISRDLRMQFDSQPLECTIPIGLLDWLEKNRADVVDQLVFRYSDN